MKQVLVIAGLTASGKSSLAIKLAKKFNGEIISADSVAVYHELNIGSAKLPLEEREGIKHHLIDIRSIDEPYNVASFQKDARQVIDDIHHRGKLPIVVGGTGLYINALIQDYRFELEALETCPEDSRDTATLYEALVTADKEASKVIHPNNRKRILRALESVNYHQKTRQTLNQNLKDVSVYDAKVFFLQGDRTKIYQRIEKRVDVMFESGLVKEVKDLYMHNQAVFDLQSMQSIGYREFAPYFAKDIDLEEVERLIKRNTRRFAKRQLTWFKHQTESDWIDIFVPDYETALIDATTKWLGAHDE